jgi:hypothetical protein
MEWVELRALLSGAVAVAPLIYPPPVLVRGHAHGAAVVHPSVPDVGTLYDLRGTGKVAPMGNVSVHGTIQTTSFTGRPIGTLTISNGSGTVRLRITDRASPETPHSFRFTVTSATGAFTKLAGTGGVLDLKITPVGRSGAATFKMDINPIVILSR